MTLLNEATFVCLDCEFTGLDLEEDRIIEVAALRFTLSDELEAYESLVDPQRTISEESYKIHGISASMVQGKPTIEEILPQFLAFVGKDPIVGHAVGIDLDMLEKGATRAQIPFKLKERPFIDTLRLARHYGDSPNNSLETLAKHFNIPTEGAHRAMHDVRMNIAVFKHLIHKYKTVDEVFKILSKPIRMKYMPLGQHKGRLFKDVPLQYLQWAANMDFDQDLLFTIRSELQRRKKGGGFSHSTNPFSNL